MENKNIIAIAFLIILVGVVYNVSSKNSEVSDKLQATPVENKSVTNEFKDSFMQGCMDSSEYDSVKLYDYCSCSYDKLETKLGKDGIVDFGIQYSKTGELPKGTIETISECMYKIL